MENSTVVEDVNDVDVDGFTSHQDSESVETSERVFYKQGDLSRGGDIIKTIIGQSKDIIVYLGHNDSLGWEIKNKENDERTVIAIGECHRLKGIIVSRVARKFQLKIYMRLGSTLVNVLSSSDKNIHLHFKPIEDMIEEAIEEIDKILSGGPNFEIYRTKKGGVSYWHKELPNYVKPAVGEFNQLMNFSKIALPKNDRQLVVSQLGSSLSVAFNSQEGEDVLRGFTKVEEFINSRANSHAKFWYISYNSILFVFTILLVLLFYFYSGINMAFLVGAVGGLTGAFLSTLTRIDKLSFDILAPFRNVVLQGYSRLLVGIISGLFIIIASKANLALGTYSENINSLAVFALISGFSERFVPDLISTLSASTKEVDLQNKESK